MRRLRVLSGHPHLGRPNDVVREFEGAQAYVDAGFCEWVGDGDAATPAGPVVVVDRAGGLVETTDAPPEPVEKTTVRPTARGTAPVRRK